MAVVTNARELMTMLNKGQDELKRSMHDLTAVKGDTNKRHHKKTLFEVHSTPQKPTRKRARTQQLAAEQVQELFCIIVWLKYCRAAGVPKTIDKLITSGPRYST